MTIQEFVTVLETATPNDWWCDIVLKDRRMLRRVDPGVRLCCPITSLGREKWPVTFVKDAKRLGLSPDDAERIAVTADDFRDHPLFDPALRVALEKATVGRKRPANERAA